MAKEKIKDGVHQMSEYKGYVWPEDPKVLEHLKYYSGLKLGFMMHFAPVTQIGTYESWPLVDSHWAWCQEDVDWTDIETFKKQYWELNKTFNPIRFNAEKIASLAEECGFRYLLFTTKHHDGFCMYDSKYSDYKITAEDCPYHSAEKPDIVRALYEAFRKRDMAIGTYFSKPDWHSEYYWVPEFGPAKNNNANYDPKEKPEIWEKYIEYVYNQIKELCSNYGKIDCLWLDGGQVQPSINNQDIRLSELVKELRDKYQPHLVVVDRAVTGENENILTPEQEIPNEKIPVPWETCMTLQDHFSYHYSSPCKSARDVTHKFIEILSKGGSLALNVTPQPNGDLPIDAVHTLRQFGRFVKSNAEAIYDSGISPCPSWRHLRYTRKDSNDYAFYLYKEHPKLPARLCLYFDENRRPTSVHCLRTGQDLPFKVVSHNTIDADPSDIDMFYAEYADCFRISYED